MSNVPLFFLFMAFAFLVTTAVGYKFPKMDMDSHFMFFIVLTMVLSLSFVYGVGIGLDAVDEHIDGYTMDCNFEHDDTTNAESNTCEESDIGGGEAIGVSLLSGPFVYFMGVRGGEYLNTTIND